MMASSPLTYLVILNIKNQPIFFSFFGEKHLRDELNFQMHCYSALDFFKERIQQRRNQYIGHLSSIYSCDGDYDIYGYYSITKIKIMAVLSQKLDEVKYDEGAISKLLKQTYQTLQTQILNPFGEFAKNGKLEQKFYDKIRFLGNNFSPK